jgi:DNA-binding GntR family transcriptional regulator
MSLFTSSEKRVPEKTSVAIARAIRAAILDGRLAPGEPLRESQLAESLGTSRTPIREALILLEREGLVQGTPNKGSTVRMYDREELEDLYNIRAALEGHAAREAARRVDDEAILLLEDSCDRFRKLRRSKNIRVPDLTNENMVFHDIILRAAGSGRLARMVAEVTALPSIQKAYMSYTDAHRKTVEEAHRAITAALKARDGEAAAELMQAHVLWARDRALAWFSRPS